MKTEVDMEHYSDYLFATPSILEGIARLLDFGNTLNEYNVSPSGVIADEIAISMDWRMAGISLRNAMKEYVEEKQEPAIPNK